MKTPKIMMAFLAIVAVVVFFKAFGIPMWGAVTIVSLLSISMMMIVGPIVGLVVNKSHIKENVSMEEAEQLQKEKKKLKIVMAGLGWGLSGMVVGVLFKSMHWPGASFMLKVGAIAGMVMAVVAILLSWRSKEYVTVKYLGVVSLLFALLFGTPYLYGCLDKIKYRGFHKYCEAVDACLRDDSLENRIRVGVETEKIGTLNWDSERYNRLSELEDLANQLAKGEDNAKIVYVLNGNYNGGLNAFGPFQCDRFAMVNAPVVRLADYVDYEVGEGDVLYVVTDEEGVKDRLVELGVEEGNIVMVGQE